MEDVSPILNIKGPFLGTFKSDLTLNSVQTNETQKFKLNIWSGGKYRRQRHWAFSTQRRPITVTRSGPHTTGTHSCLSNTFGPSSHGNNLLFNCERRKIIIRLSFITDFVFILPHLSSYSSLHTGSCPCCCALMYFAVCMCYQPTYRQEIHVLLIFIFHSKFGTFIETKWSLLFLSLHADFSSVH